MVIIYSVFDLFYHGGFDKISRVFIFSSKNTRDIG